MKKIMFNDKIGLTQAVLDGRKTMTRREIKNEVAIAHCEDGYFHLAPLYANYRVGEVVAIAQAYKYVFTETGNHKINMNCAGWNNKMFVSASRMPHHIRITNVRVERLQDISDEDCLREGVSRLPTERPRYDVRGIDGWCFDTPQIAFHALIDKVSGKGTWESNPFVFVYEFELVD